MQELIKFAMTHGGGEHIDVVGSVVADALSTIRGELQVLGSTDLKYISNLYLKVRHLNHLKLFSS